MKLSIGAKIHCILLLALFYLPGIAAGQSIWHPGGDYSLGKGVNHIWMRPNVAGTFATGASPYSGYGIMMSYLVKANSGVWKGSGSGTASMLELIDGSLTYSNASVSNDSNPIWNHRFVVTKSGNVGIGTTSPVVKFDVHSTGADDSHILIGAAGTGRAELVLDASNGDAAGSDYLELYQTDDLDAHLRVAGGNGNLIIQESGGNVGIGTASPSRKLHIVSGTAYDYPLLLQAPTTPAIQFIDNTAGTVGYIGGGASGFLTGGGGYGLTIRSEATAFILAQTVQPQPIWLF